MPLTVEDQAYLQRKHQGGVSDEKGNKYQLYYTTIQIITYLKQYADDLSSITLQAQVPDTFVDDLKITAFNHIVYHQLKATQNLSCRAINTGAKVIEQHIQGRKRCLIRRIQLPHPAASRRMCAKKSKGHYAKSRKLRQKR